MSACPKCGGSGRLLNERGQARVSAAMFDGDEHVCLQCAGTGQAPPTPRSYPDTITSPIDPPTVSGPDVCRDVG